MYSIDRLCILCVFLLALLSTQVHAQCGTNIDLGTWVQEGVDANGSWTVTNGGNTVDQSINGDPTFYVSPDSFANVVITGTITVNSAGASFVDNDWVGFVFGYESPDTTDSAYYDFYLFDWKKDDQTFGGFLGKEGFSLSKVEGAVTNFPEAFSGNTGPFVTALDSNYGNTLGWNFDQTYAFALTYTNTRTVISIEGDTIFDIYGCFEPGRFGFYNYSQEQVSYSDFSYRVAAEFEVLTPDVCVDDTATAIAVSDSCNNAAGAAVNNTIVGWEWDMGDGVTIIDTNAKHVYNTPGTYTVRLIVTDYLGCMDTAFSEIEVFEVTTDLGNDTTICPEDSVTLDAGTSGSIYAWSTSATTQTETLNDSGAYAVTVSIPLGCEAIDTFNLAYFAPPTKPFGNDTAICSSDSLVLDAGNVGSTYLWQDGSTNQTFTATVSGTYNVTITSANGCVTLDTLILTVNPVPTVALGNDTSFCSPDSITLDAGNAGASFLWHDGNTNQTRSAPDSGVYSVTVTDANACNTVDSILVTIFQLPNIGLTVSEDTLCFGDTATLTVSGGTSYAWDNDAGLSAYDTNIVQAFPATTTTYTISVTNSHGCTDSLDTAITVNPLPTLSLTTQDDTICNEDTTLLTITGAASYVWDNTGFLTFESNDSARAFPDTNTTFTVVATDSNGCVDTARVTVHVDTLPTLLITPSVNRICLHDSLDLIASGAQTYAWTPNYDISALVGDSVRVHPNLDTTYMVVGTDANGCIGDTSFLVIVDTLPIVNLSASNPEFCIGDSTGILATGAATYEWTAQASLSTLTGDSTVATPTVSTIYEVIGTDTFGCKDTNDISITVNSLPLLAATPAVDNICLNDSVNLLMTGTGNATFTWSNPSSLNIALDDSVFAKPTVTTTYTITGTDTNGCVDSTTALVNVDTLPVVTVTPGNSDLCLGSSLTLTAGGAQDYTWSPGTGLNSTTGTSVIASTMVTTLYSIVGVDANGCSADTSLTITVNPLPVIAVNPIDPTICLNDTVQLTASGAITYEWVTVPSAGAFTGAVIDASPDQLTEYLAVGTDANGCSSTAGTFVFVNPLPDVEITLLDDTICLGESQAMTAVNASTYQWAASTTLNTQVGANVVATPTVNTTYTVTGTDANSCSASADTTIAVDTLPDIIINPSMHAMCVGEDVVLQASGATDFTWTPAASLNISVGSTVISSATDTVTYTVTGTDDNSCMNDTTVTVNVTPLPVLTLGFTDDTVCTGTADTLFAQGAITYEWSNNGNVIEPVNDTLIVFPLQTQIYGVVGTGPGGCQSTDFLVVNVHDIPTFSAGADTFKCIDETIQLQASGGVNYTWTDTTGLSDTTIADPLCSATSTTTYTVLIEDNNGCVFSDDVTVNVNPRPQIDPGADRAICIGDDVMLGGNNTGPANATFLWTAAILDSTLVDSTQSNPMVAPDTSTTYSVRVTASNGCADVDTIRITVNPLPVLEILEAPELICRGDTETVLVTAGYPMYEWTGTDSIIDSMPGTLSVSPEDDATYFLLVEDTNGCQNNLEWSVSLEERPIVRSGPDLEMCVFDSVQLEAEEDSLLIFSWSNGSLLSNDSVTNPIAKPDETTTFSLLGTDSNGCTSRSNMTVFVYELPYIDAGDDLVNCDMNRVMLGGLPSGPEGANYEWTPTIGLDDSTAANPFTIITERTTYTLTVTTQFGCVSSDTIRVITDCWSVYAPSAFSPDGNGINDEYFIKYYRIQNPKLQVWDRFGHLVFETLNLDRGWNGKVNDGREAPMGVYFWQLTFEDEIGRARSDEGTLTLVR